MVKFQTSSYKAQTLAQDTEKTPLKLIKRYENTTHARRATCCCESKQWRRSDARLLRVTSKCRQCNCGLNSLVDRVSEVCVIEVWIFLLTLLVNVTLAED